MLNLQPEKVVLHRAGNSYNPPPRSFERVHDPRLVRSSETSADEHIHRVAPDACDPLFLGDRVLRVLRPGSGQPHRFRRQRRPFLAGPAVDHPGGGVADSVHPDRDLALQGRGPSLESFRRFRMPDSGCLFRFLKIIYVK